MPIIIEKYNAGMVTQLETVITKIKTDVNPKTKSLNDLADVDNNINPLDGDLLQYNNTTKQFETISPELLSIEKGSLDKAFTIGESSIITLNQSMSDIPIVSATIEQPSTNINNTTWDVEPDGSDYDIQDFAYDDTVTPSATTGDITLTLGTGVWNASDVGRTVSGNGGIAVITSQSGTAVANASVKTDFIDISTISSGLWTSKGLIFDATNGVELSNYVSSAVDTNGLVSTISSTLTSEYSSEMTSVKLNDGNIALIYRQGVSPYYLKGLVIQEDGTIVTSETAITTVNSYNISASILSNGKICITYTDGDNSLLKFIILNTDLTINVNNVTIKNSVTSALKNIAVLNGKFAVAYEQDTTNYPCFKIFNNDGTIATSETVLNTEDTGSYVNCCELTNGNFAIAYIKNVSLYESYYEIRDSYGNGILAKTLFLADRAYYITIKELTNNNIFICYRDVTNDDFRATIMNSSGSSVVSNTQLDTASIGTVLNINKSPNYDILVGFQTYESPYDYCYMIIQNDGTITKSKTALSDGVGTSSGSCCVSDDGDALFFYSNSTVNNTVLKRGDFVTLTVTSASLQYYPAVTNSLGQIDTSLWLDITSMTATDILDSGEVLYAISTDNQATFQIAQTGQSPRNIARYNVDTWEYNSDAIYLNETWTTSTTNDKLSALSEAMSISSNKMTGSQLDAIQSNEQFTLGDTLDLAIILYTGDNTKVPSSDGVTVNANTAIEYKGAVHGTDYTWVKETDTRVKITALTAGNYKVRII